MMKMTPFATTLTAAALLLAAPTLFAQDRKTDGKPNPVVEATSKAVATLRADKDMRALLKAYAALQPKAVEELADVSAARAGPTFADAVGALLKAQNRPTDPEVLVPGIRSVDRTIPGAAGELPARVYTPEGAGPFPVILYFHGGGWVLADKQVYDGGARGLARQAQAVLVSVDYRRAPEDRFPAAWDDALAAYRWLLDQAASIRGDPLRVALAGEGAGGNLALATAIAARDAGLLRPAHVLAIYPLAQTRMNTESYLANAIARPLSRARVRWSLDQLVRTDADLKDPRLQLVDARLEGLPPVTLVNAQIDPLRSDGVKLEQALRKARVPVLRNEYEGVTHDFFGAAAVLHKARQAQQFAGERLKAAFSVPPAN